jgi:hypothetical protein
LGRNSCAINSRHLTFDYEKTKATISSRIRAETTAEHDGPEPEVVMMVEVTWMQPYLAYMLNKTLPKDVVESRRIMRRSKAFVVVKGALYKKSISADKGIDNKARYMSTPEAR